MNNPQGVLSIVEDYYNVPIGSIESRCRTRTVADARAMAMYVLKQRSTYSYEELSRMFKRDVSGIKKNCKKIVKALRNDNEQVKHVYTVIIEELNRGQI